MEPSILLPKVHKPPWATRPVVSQCGSILEHLSKLLDFELQKVLRLSPGYLKDSWELNDKLNSFESLLKDPIIFSADAVAMYPNINADHALEIMEKWLELHKAELPPNYPTATILKGLEIVMRNSIFESLGGSKTQVRQSGPVWRVPTLLSTSPILKKPSCSKNSATTSYTTSGTLMTP
jgi:hypothetical protein